MISDVVLAVCSVACEHLSEEDFNVIDYDCSAVPPFFGGHPLFLGPVSRKCENGRTRATFVRNKQIVTITGVLLKDLMEIFVFF